MTLDATELSYRQRLHMTLPPEHDVARHVMAAHAYPYPAKDSAPFSQLPSRFLLARARQNSRVRGAQAWA